MKALEFLAAFVLVQILTAGSLLFVCGVSYIVARSMQAVIQGNLHMVATEACTVKAAQVAHTRSPRSRFAQEGGFKRESGFNRRGDVGTGFNGTP